MSRADAKYFLTAEDKTGPAFKSFAGSIKRAAAGVAKIGGAALGAGIAGFAVMAREALQSADRVHKLSQATGASTELLSELRGIASLSGSDFETMGKGIGKLSKNLGAAKLGLKAPNDALAAMGITVRELAGLTVDQQFERVGGALAKMRDPAIRAKVGMDLFGKSYGDVIQVFSGGVAGFREMREEQVALGRSMSKEGVEGAAAANDAMDRLQQTIQGMVEVLTLEFADDLAEFVAKLKDVVVPTIAAVAEGIGRIGRLIGGVFAAGGAALSGNFAGAGAVLGEAVGQVFAGADAAEPGEATALLREMAANTSRMAGALAGP